jgi:hypothetical protein
MTGEAAVVVENVVVDHFAKRRAGGTAYDATGKGADNGAGDATASQSEGAGNQTDRRAHFGAGHDHRDTACYARGSTDCAADFPCMVPRVDLRGSASGTLDWH